MVPRCGACSRVLNSDGSCPNEVECPNHKLEPMNNNDFFCLTCKHYAPKEIKK